MKTMIEIQYNGNNVTDKNLDKYVKEDLKAKGLKTTEIDTLNMYYVLESNTVYYVANKKDGETVNGELDVNEMPDYSVAPVKKTTRKAAAKSTKTTKTTAKKTTKKATK